MGIVLHHGKRRPSTKMDSENVGCQAAHPSLIANLVKCVESAKHLLDHFLSMPTASISSLPLSECYRIILATAVLYRLSLGLPKVPDWNANTAQQTVDLEEYLNSLQDRFQSVQGRTLLRTNSADNLFAMFPDILNSVKSSYTSARDCPSILPDYEKRAHQNFSMAAGSCTSTTGMRKTYGCPGLRYLSRQSDNSTNQSTLDDGVAADLEAIENEMFWSDVLTTDNFD
jgi:hypothetical protein